MNELTQNSYKAIDEGVYNSAKYDYCGHEPISMRKSILSCPHAPLITEIKFASPSKGRIVGENSDTISRPTIIASNMVGSGAVGLSIVTQPNLFGGSPEYLGMIRKTVTVPLLMKDIIVSDIQIDSAKRMGADCILLIKSIFDSNLTEGSIEKLADYANKKRMQIVFEVHKEQEFREVLKSFTDPRQNLIGINNRDLNDLSVDIATTTNLLNKIDKRGHIIISESGISKAEEIQQLKKAGADAFLIGTSIMESRDRASKVAELYLSV
ncbi:MAG TPA: indole-3-glycerol-phosphate synthase [Candidatus Nitrosopolaris sp.]|nr:indole-3-glycerol-phosphate synthase [Candidatus Nitrosopolaris sp.]